MIEEKEEFIFIKLVLEGGGSSALQELVDSFAYVITDSDVLPLKGEGEKVEVSVLYCHITHKNLEELREWLDRFPYIKTSITLLG